MWDMVQPRHPDGLSLLSCTARLCRAARGIWDSDPGPVVPEPRQNLRFLAPGPWLVVVLLCPWQDWAVESVSVHMSSLTRSMRKGWAHCALRLAL